MIPTAHLLQLQILIFNYKFSAGIKLLFLVGCLVLASEL